MKKYLAVGPVAETSRELLMSVLDYCLVEAQELDQGCFDLESLEHFQEPVVSSSP